MSLELKNVMFDLSAADGVSGEESCAAQCALKYLKNYTDNCFIKNGNVIGNFGDRKNGTPHILIDAHIDQVGLIVTNIYESGFVGFSNVGGIDRRLLPAQQVCIHGKKKLAGVVCSTPPHLSGSDNKINKIEDFYIDTGMSFEALSNIVEPGDRITFASMPKELLNNRITGPALDDRSGVASILYALELLKNRKYECSFSIVFSAQEELGERGAKIAAFDIDPDIAIAVDVSFAYCLGDREYECGKMGQGTMIGISPSLSREISDNLIEISKNENIPYQLEVMNGLTSTNADQFSVN
ncbi:MAG: M42 family peptidase, partial [Oscillospiraceae bacterium]|nr:M42 family peptidase [Oscillospiraceae bacterium]